MHPEVNDYIEFVKQQYPQYFENKKVLEVGSLDLNGSVRHHFTDCNYTGIDLGEGVGVDIVSPIHELPLIGYDVVISTEMLEHDRYWELSLQSMYEQLNNDGILILTCAGPKRKEHGTTAAHADNSPFTNEYYRNISIQDFSTILPPNLFSCYSIRYGREWQDLYFYSIPCK